MNKIIKSLVLLSVALIISPLLIFAEDTKIFDKYDCIIEQIIEDCNAEEIWLLNEEQQWVYLENNDRDYLKEYLVNGENEGLRANREIIQAGSRYNLLGCKEENTSTPDHMLQFYIDHFLWDEKEIICTSSQNVNISMTLFGVSLVDISLVGGITIFSLTGIIYFIKKKKIRK